MMGQVNAPGQPPDSAAKPEKGQHGNADSAGKNDGEQRGRRGDHDQKPDGRCRRGHDGDGFKGMARPLRFHLVLEKLLSRCRAGPVERPNGEENSGEQTEEDRRAKRRPFDLRRPVEGQVRRDGDHRPLMQSSPEKAADNGGERQGEKHLPKVDGGNYSPRSAVAFQDGDGLGFRIRWVCTP